jgi:tetratricopeptide (TPR) repeat protein
VNESQIFLDALKLADPATRAAFLDATCAGNPALRAAVEALLKARDDDPEFLEQPAASLSGTLDAPPQAPTGAAKSEHAGTVIGPYKLVEQIGEGGMGTVWMAQQTEPVKRLVAVKLIKAGMDSAQVIARFEAERQALALMDHPNIARVLDGGQTPPAYAGGSPRPYFVMDLVKGVPITKYCDEHRLTPRQRLELFLPVCQAVQHAHQKGIIHRDLKPSNVLVAVYDGRPVPKVIDFGVAKAAGQSLTDKTLVTGFGNIVGTLEYMSPEQAEVNQLDIDTRSDIYSLGVLLYELLTGGPPFTKKDLEKAGMLEMLRVIREQEPSRPSTKLSSSDALPTLSANRSMEPAKLTRLVRGELDWIVMKALEKDRNRRYESANAMAMDVQRYVNGEAVLAHPPSAGYRLRKFVRRQRAALAFAGLTLLFLVLFGAGLGWAAGDRAARHRVREVEADNALSQAARCLEEGKWPESAAWAERADGILAGGEKHPAGRSRLQAIRADLDMVARVQEIRIRQSQVRDEGFDIAAADPEFAQAFRDYGIDVEALDVDQAAAAIRARPIWLELVLALDDWAVARRNRQPDANHQRHLLAVARAADDDHLRNQLRQALEQQPIDRPALERLAASDEVGELPVPTLVLLDWSLRAVGAVDAALRVLEQAVQRYPSNFWVNQDLARCLETVRPPRWQEALRFYMAARALRPQSPGVRLNLGVALADSGDLKGAVVAFEEAMHLKPDYATPYYARGIAYHGLGQEQRALADYTRATELKPDFVKAWYNRGITNYRLHRPEKAVADYTKAIELKADYAEAWIARGNAHLTLGHWEKAVDDSTRAIALKPDEAVAWYNRGNAHAGLGQREKAIADYTNAIELKPDYVEAWYNRGNAHHGLGRREQAIADYTRAIELKPDFASAWYNRGNAHRLLGQRDQAVADYTKAIALQPGHAHAWGNRGLVYAALGLTDKAIADYTRAIELQRDYANAWYNRGNAYSALRQWDKAVADFAKAAELMPASSAVLNRLAWRLANCPEPKVRDPRRAVELATKATQLQPKQANYWNTLGVAHYRAGSLKEAVAALEKSMELRKGGDSNDWFLLAMAHWQIGHRDEARKWYDKAVEWMEKNQPQNEELRRFRAEAAGVLGLNEKK